MYTSFYNLREDPFRLTSDPRFFHLAEPHAAASATLVEAVRRRKGLVVMSGEIGTGKTTVLHTALHILIESATASNSIASAFILNPTLGRDEFLETILDEFEVPCTSTSKPARLSALQQMLLNTQRRGGTSVLLVDEAHLLTTELLEEIRLLSNADTCQEKLLQIIMSGQPELLSLLCRPELRALRQRIACSCALRPLTAAETQAYVGERLHAAGLRGPTNPFAADALDGVFRYSRGVPRLINMLCDTALEIGCKTRRLLIQAQVIEEAAAELGLTEAGPAPVLRELVPTPAPVISINGANHGAPSDTEILSAVDLLIHAMRKRRASASG